MPVADLPRDRVESRLAALEETYASFAVSQTTLSVSPSVYERAREQCAEGLADVYAQVYNGAGDVLLVEGDGEWVVPHAKPDRDEPLEAGTCRTLAERTGVECSVTDLERVTILGVRHGGDPERDTVYRLVPVFSAERVDGTPGDDAAWHSELPESALPTY
jgi:ADP-ribose pyrophosphatase YjhB (NUDIX family)